MQVKLKSIKLKLITLKIKKINLMQATLLAFYNSSSLLKA
jgi:hypothetical protein